MHHYTIKQIKEELGDCDWMRIVLSGWTVDAILWMIYRIEELERRINENSNSRL